MQWRQSVIRYFSLLTFRQLRQLV